MKLLSAINRFYLASISLFFIVAGVMLYYSIQHHINDELDEQLRAEQVHFSNAIEHLESLRDYPSLMSDFLSVEKVLSGVHIEAVLFDSTMYSSAENEVIPFRLIRFSAQTQKETYIITIKRSEIESNDLALTIFWSLILLFGLFAIMLFVANYFFSKRLWTPFIDTIAAIKSLNINDRNASVEFPTSRIREFNQLNESLQSMLERLKSDFIRIKEFSENAAHEIQTPLAIIHTKLESLLQRKDLNIEDALIINQAMESTSRLSRLNKTLLLLTKIENRQYEEKQNVNFSTIIDKYIELYSDIISDKKLKLEINKADDFLSDFHPVLADILVSNLLSNAIMHNVDNGSLYIKVYKDGFEIRNSGEKPEFSTELLFNRFKKGNHSSDHLGLGLALAKEIAETNGLVIKYEFEAGMHIIGIRK